MVIQKDKQAVECISLNGKWKMRWEPIDTPQSAAKKIGHCNNGWYITPVPGDIHQGLVAAGVIEEPTCGLNAPNAIWTRQKSWWLRKTFRLSAGQISNTQQINLRLDGLDCNAWIFVNDRLAGEHNSAFRPFIKDIKSIVRPGVNRLLVRLTDGLDCVSDEDFKHLEGFVPVDAVRPERGQPKRVFVRKAQYSWGWDWSPESSTTGITQDASIHLVYSDYIEDVAVRISGSPNKPSAVVTVKTQRANSFCARPATIEVAIFDPQGRSVDRRCQRLILQSGSSFTTFEIGLPRPQLWWPNGAGEQPLYTVKVRLSGEQALTHLYQTRFGIRFVQLDTDNTMCIKINGRNIFCKGANFIPADMFYARASGEQYRKLVQQARDANFTMLRIWGGGVYLPDEFYDACDEYGIMVWHDFMFACAPYPDYLPSFCNEVRQEAEYQLIRLRNHPSIVLWCGSNENIWARSQSKNKDNGAVIMGSVLPEAVHRCCPEIPYFYSSPYGTASNHIHISNTGIGDCHCWDDTMMSPDISTRTDFKTYDKINAKFISEYGFPGACGIDTTLQYLGKSHSVGKHSDSWKYHYNTFAENTVEQAIKRHYGYSDNLSFEDFLYYSGVVQGRVYAYSIESFRRRSECFGGLFWMFNDCWGEVGWSIVDYYLRRKISYWFVRRALAHKKLIIRRNAKHKLQLTLVNDTAEKLSDKITLYWYRFSDQQRVPVAQKKLSLSGAERVTVDCIHPDADPRQGCWLAEAEKDGIEPASYFDTEFCRLLRASGEVAIKKTVREGQGWSVDLSCEQYVHAVELNVPDTARPNDNYFDLYPGKVRRIFIDNLKKLPSRLILRTL